MKKKKLYEDGFYIVEISFFKGNPKERYMTSTIDGEIFNVLDLEEFTEVTAEDCEYFRVISKVDVYKETIKPAKECIYYEEIEDDEEDW